MQRIDSSWWLLRSCNMAIASKSWASFTAALVLMALHFFCTSTAEHNFTDCYAANEPNEYNSCSVSYTDRLRLVCPNTTASTASWGRRTNNGTVVPVCLYQPICEVAHDLQYEDSGTYFCTIPGTASRIENYYVNISVLAPPLLLGVQQCVKDKNLCVYGELHPQPLDPFFNVTVQYTGYGEFSVVWSHNLKPFVCRQPDCNQATASSEAWIAIYNTRTFDLSENGTYFANVSSEYGWNMSATQVKFNCGLIPKPTGPSENKSVELTAGESAAIACKVPMQPASAKLGICFAQVGESLGTLNHTNSCVECDPTLQGVCSGSFATKPGWRVTRSSYQTAACMYMQVTNLTIPAVQKDDRGTLYCYWSGSSEIGPVYQTYKITVSSNSWLNDNWEYLVVAALGFALVLVLLVCVISIARCWLRSRRQRIRRLLDIIDCRPPTGSDNQSDSRKHPSSSRAASVKRKPKAQSGRRGRTVRKMPTNWTYPSDMDGPTSGTSDSEYFRPQRYTPRNSACTAVNIEVHEDEKLKTPLLQAQRSARGDDKGGSSPTSSYGSTDEHMETEGPLIIHTDPEWDLPPQEKDTVTLSVNNV